MRKLYKKLFSDGVMPNPSTNMQVSAGTGMNVTVSAGFAICNGCLKLEESSRTIAVQASESAYDRIDTVVLRLNDNDSARICDFYVLKGTPATSPIRPALTQTESIWEIGLADLFIAKNSTGISNQRITDTRYETARCGVISSISQFDTTTLYNQIQADLASFQDVNEAEFLAWFDEMKDQLSEDAAGNLQNEIDQTRSMLSDAYSAAKSYAVGDYCIHDNTLYKCNTAISSEAWTEAHWTETSISSENVALTNSVSLLNSNLTSVTTADIVIANSNGNNVKIACRNGVVTCDYPYGGLKSLPTGATNLGTIPEQFRPLYQVLTSVDNLSENNIAVLAYPDGRLLAYNYGDAYTGNLNFGFGMSWIIND